MLIAIFLTTNAYGDGYPALDGVNDIKVVFDVRAKKASSAEVQIDLIHQTFRDQGIRKVTDKPDFVVVFAGSAVKYISNATDSLSNEEKALASMIADTVKAMARDGIKMEVCLYAADLYDVEPASILPEIKHVGNGWISLIGYQSRGYTLVGAY